MRRSRLVIGAAGLGLLSTAALVAVPATRPATLGLMDSVGLGSLARRIGSPDAQAATAPPPPAAAAPLTVTVVDAAMRPFRDQLFVSGTLVAREEAMVGAQVDGLRIDAVLAEDGDRVREGQVLARLDRTQLDTLVTQSDAALARADAAIAQARSVILQYEATGAQLSADYLRGKQLGLGIISQATLDQRLAVSRAAEAQLAGAQGALSVALADKKSQEAQRRELEVRMARTDVRAPVSGTLSRRTARLGAQTGGGEALFRIVREGAIDLDAEAPDDVLARVTLGIAAQVTLAGSDVPVAGTVRLISNEVDKATRLGRVRIALGHDAQARVGSFASAVVDIARREGVSVPASAVARSERGRAVQVVRDGRIEVRRVETGLSSREAVEITDGLKPGETVVARAAAFLRAGDQVRAMAPSVKESSR